MARYNTPARTPRRALPEQEIIDLYLRGETTVSLAKRYGVSRSPIERILHRAKAMRTNGEDTRRRFAAMTPEQRSRHSWRSHAARRGTKKTMEVRLRMAAGQAGRVKSSNEEAVLAALRAMGMAAEPGFQFGVFLIDIALRGEMVAVEIDGGNWHESPRKQAQDAVKEAALTAAGWRIVRFSGKALKYPDLCAVKVDVLRRDPAAWRGERVLRCRANDVAPPMERDKLTGRILPRKRRDAPPATAVGQDQVADPDALDR